MFSDAARGDRFVGGKAFAHRFNVVADVLKQIVLGDLAGNADGAGNREENTRTQDVRMASKT